ncbi:MAG TPA: hypothetical protein VGB71_03340 [Flavisolibacter sp.]
MESWENKVIADKLDSLDNLPEGYTPNLSSKWEIVQSGLNKYPRNGSYKRWLPVFLFVLFGSIAAWMIIPQHGSETISAAKNMVQAVNIVPEQKEAPTKKIFVIPAKQRSEKKKATNTRQAMDYFNLEKTRNIEPVPVVIQPVVPKPDTLQLQQKNNLKITMPIAMKTKQTKKVYQRDFSGVANIADPTHQKTAQKSFQIKLGLQSNKDVSTSQPPALRLTQNF